MALLDSVKDFYGKMEDGYYSFLDSLQERGIPVYKAVDAIEGANIPSFPVAIIATLLVVFGVYSLLSGAMGGAILNVSVQDQDLNPVPGAEVTALLDGKEVDSQTTNTSGNATLRVPQNSQIKITVSKNGFSDSGVDFLAQHPEESKTITLSSEVITITKTITFTQAGTSRLLSDPVTVSFSCTGNDFASDETVRGGTIDLEVQSDCDTLLVVPAAGYNIENGSVSFASDDIFQFEVEKSTAGTGAAVVTVSNSQGQTVAGVDVTIYTPTADNRPGSAIQTKSTSANGTAVFESAASGRYYIVAFDRSGNYAEYDGLKENLVQEISIGGTSSFAVVMAQSVAGKISVVVRDKATSDTISGAKVTLSKGQTQISTLTTDDSGKVEFPVGEDVTYSILVDKAGYLLSNTTAKPAADSTIVQLEEANSQNSQSLLVTVVDENDKAIENVKLKLRENADGSQAGSDIVTGLDGRALFERVDSGVYYVYAIKPGYGEKTSDPVQISDRQQNVLKLKIPLGNGSVDISVLDEQGKPVAGADIKAVDAATLQTVSDSAADSDGRKIVTVRSDKSVFLIVGANGFLSTTTVPVQMQKDVSVQKKVVLSKSVQSFGIEFAGLYSGNESVSESGSSLSAGQKYTAKFRVLVPRNATFDEVAAHIRTGAEKNNAIEKDFIYITNVRAAYSALNESTTYNPSTGQATDAQHQTTGDAKWANIIFRKATGGIYEIEADMQVRSEAKIGSLLEIWYRAWAKSGGYLRAPADSVLGTSESTPQKQGLYANALKTTFSIGPTSLCGDDFCERYSIEDLGNGITSNLVDSYTGQIGGRYRLLFELSSASATPFSASQFSIKDKTSSAAVESYSVKTATGDSRTGGASGSQITVDTGEIVKGSVVSGEIIFSAKKEGTIPFEVSIISGSGTASQVYSKALYVKALPASEIGVDIVPKVIVPLINNNILVHVTDDNSAIANAKVSILKDGAVIVSGETDIDGIFAYTLNSPGEGSRIGILVEKSGYRPAQYEIKVTQNIISATPSNIRLSLNVGGTQFKTINAMINNYSQIPLQVEKVSIGKEFNGYAEVSFDQPEDGTVIAVDSNAELRGTISLGTKGKDIAQPTRVKGSINVELTNPNFPQKWLASIPFELSIGFGDEVDDTECFSATPTEWKMVGSTTDTRQFTLSIANSCTVGGENVSLRDISARIVPGGDDISGTFSAQSTLTGSRNVQLGEAYTKIADSIAADGTGTIRIQFKPEDIVSANATPKIEIQATRPTSAGVQKITRTVNVTISISNLAECVEILPQSDLTVQSCPYNTGFGNYGNQFSQYSNSRYSQYDPYASRYGYGTGLPSYLNSATSNAVQGDSYYDYQGMGSYYNSYYPNTSYSSPYYSLGGVNSGFNNSWSCGGASVQIRNSCASAVDVSFDAQPGITVKEKTVKVAPNATAEVPVEPTNFFGRYGLKISAAPSGTSQKSVGLRTMYVNVTNDLAKDYRDCIAVSPSGTLSFSNFFPSPVILKVINSCYDQGVVLTGSNDTIAFLNSGILNPADPYGQTYGQPSMGVNPQRSFPTGTVPSANGVPLTGAPNAGIGGISTPINMVQSWAFREEHVEPQAGGKVRQVLEFEVVKNFSQYYNSAPDPTYFQSNTFADISNLRYTLARGYYAVSGRTTLAVRFSTPSAGARQTSFPMNVVDYWALLQYGEQASKVIRTFGDPTVSPDNCVKDEALDFSKVAGITADGVYKTELNGGLFKVSEKGGCGSQDKIQFTPTAFTKTKNGLTINVTNDGHEATVKFTGKEEWLRQGGKRVDFREQIAGTISRVSPAVSKYHNFTVIITVPANGTPGTQPGTIPGQQVTGYQDYSCKILNGTSGDDAYKNYGLQYFSFDWRYNSTTGGVKQNSCDVYDKYAAIRNTNVTVDAPQFCDATQATLAIAQKLDEIRQITSFLDVNGSAGIGQCSAASGFACANEANLKSTELYRYVLSQNNYSGSPAYFLGSDGAIADISEALNGDVTDSALKNALDNIKGKDATAANATIIISNSSTAMKKILELLASDSNKYLGASVVLEIKGQNLDVDTILPKQTLGAGWYTISLADYSKMHDEINAQIALGKCQTDTCTISGGRVVTKAYLSKLASGTWKLAAVNQPAISNNIKAGIMRNAKWAIGADQFSAKYDNFRQFFISDVNSAMYLIKDRYSDALATLVKDSYLPLKTKLGATKIEYGSTVQEIAAGDYDVTISYAWKTSKATVTFKQNRTLTKISVDNKANYALNPLFTTPIDGPIDWGTNYTGSAVSTNPLYFNDYGLTFDSGTAANTPQTKNKSNSSSTAQYGYLGTYNGGTDKGRIVSVSASGAITYSPSDPMQVSVALKNVKDKSSASLFDYKLGTLKAPLAVSWRISNAEGQNTSVKTASYSPLEICPDDAQASDLKHDGVNLDSGKGDQTIDALVYSPRGSNASIDFVPLLCRASSGDTIQISYTGSAAPEVIVTAQTANNARALKMQKDGTNAFSYNLKAIIDKVRSTGGAQVCVVTPSSGGMDLYWNDPSLLK